MINRKNFEKAAWSVTAVMLIITILFMNGSKFGIVSAVKTSGYEMKLFDNSRVHTIDIYMDDWAGFIESAASEEYSPATLIIDGEVYKNVAIRGKGNTSLSNVASMDSQRYSFKVEFDHYDKGKTYYGLDKLALNNLIQDSTMMKDYLTYTMMNEFGVKAPLCSYVYITVNGEDWGLYLAVESVEDAYLARNYGQDPGELYKPDSMGFGGGRGNGREFNMTNFWNENFGSDEEDTDERSETSSSGSRSAFPQMPGNMPGGGTFPAPGEMPEGAAPGQDRGHGGFGMGSADVKLQYIDDDPDSYSNIWNSAKTDITAADQKRLIESLNKLSENEDINSVVDIDQVIRYFVVHNYVCNGDSYTGAMIHNYYLHEKDGQLAMIPWDYNLAFGTFQGGKAQSTVNTPIDSPSSGGTEDRPMINWIYANEEYTALYHQYFSEFLSTVDIQGIIDAAYELIAPSVAKDPTAFYSSEDFEKGVETLREFCALRTESIEKQLETGETAVEMDYVDASGLTLSDRGSFGGGHGGGGEQRPDGNRPGGRSQRMSGESGDSAAAQMPEGESDLSGIPSVPGGEFPVPDFGSEMPAISDGEFGSQPAEGTELPSIPGEATQNGDRRMPQGGMPPEFTGSHGGMDAKPILIWSGVSVLFLAAGMIAAKKFRLF